MTDIEKLALVSEMAKKHKDNYKVIELGEYLKEEDRYGIIDEFCCLNSFQGFAFHPNGNCGCILAEDDYIFGIRCDHLIWVEGSCEDIECEDEKDVIIVFGNHKGSIRINFIVFNQNKAVSEPYSNQTIDYTKKTNMEILKDFCSEKKKEKGVDIKELLRFYNFYELKCDRWSGEFKVEELYKKWYDGRKKVN